MTAHPGRNQFFTVHEVPVDRPGDLKVRWRLSFGFARPEGIRAILLAGARVCHTWSTRDPVDIIAIDAHMTVVALATGIMPASLIAFRRPAKHVVALVDGYVRRQRVEIGDVVEFVPVWSRSCEYW